MKFSELISELTELWLLWMKNNAIVRDETLSVNDRKIAAEECEKLINREYEITEQLDNYFTNE
jgi:hypothetical protein